MAWVQWREKGLHRCSRVAEREPGAHVRNQHSSKSLYRVQWICPCSQTVSTRSKILWDCGKCQSVRWEQWHMGSASPDRKHEKNVVFNCLVFVKESKTMGEQVAALMFHIKHFETGARVPVSGRDHHRLKQKSSSGKYWKVCQQTHYEILKICYILTPDRYREQIIGWYWDDRKSNCLVEATFPPTSQFGSQSQEGVKAPPSRVHGYDPYHRPNKKHTK